MTEDQKTDDLKSLDDAAQVLGVSKPTLYRLLAAGELRGMKVGRQWRFRSIDLTEYLERSPLSLSLPRTSEIEVEIAFFEEALRAACDDIPEPTPDCNRSPAEQQALLLVDRILQYAITLRASDVHIEPMHIDTNRVVLVRYRIDGLLQEIRRIPEPAREAVAASFKTAADLNAAERRTPQQGQLNFRFQGKLFRIIISSMPLLTGEEIVMRIVSNDAILVPLDRIGLNRAQLDQIERLIAQPIGLLVFAGPVGSGKVTTLYSCLRSIASPHKKLLTIEDLVTVTVSYATQVQIEKHSELPYVNALRVLRRHDPDVMYLDDIPDQVTAAAAAEFVLNGHLLLINVLARDVAGAFAALVDIGFEPHVVGRTVIGIVAQRLVRKLCSNCKKPVREADPAMMNTVRELAAQGGYDVPNDAVFYEEVGCDQCGNRGYKGRAGLYEILEATQPILSAAAQGASPEEIRKLVRAAGIRSVFADGIEKAAQGLTSIQEVMRVTYPLV